MAFPHPFFPSTWRILKRAAPALLWIRWVALFFLVLIGSVFLLLHLYIVPHINDFRPRLSAFLAQSTGAAVQIERLNAKSKGLFPEFTVYGLRISEISDSADSLKTATLLDADTALRNASSAASPKNAPVVKILLDLPYFFADITWRSALRLAFSELHVDKAQLRIERLSPTLLRVAGFKVRLDGPSDPTASDWFFSQQHVKISNSSVVLDDSAAGSRSILLASVPIQIKWAQMRNIASQHLFDIQLLQKADHQTLDSPAEISLQADMRQAPFQLRRGDWRKWNGSVLLESKDFDIAQLLAQTNLAPGLERAKLNTSSQLYLRKGVVTEAKVTLDAQDILLHKHKDTPAVALKHWRTKLVYGSGQRNSSDASIAANAAQNLVIEDWSIAAAGSTGEWSLPTTTLSRIPSLNIDRAQTARPVARADDSVLTSSALADNTADNKNESPIAGSKPAPLYRWQTTIGLIPLDLVARIFAQAPLPPTLDATQKRIAAMQVRGRVKGLSFGFDQGSSVFSPSGIDLRGKIESLVVSAYQSQPGVGGVDLSFKVEDHSGSVNVDLKNGWVDLPRVFEDGRIALNNLSTTLNWTYQRSGEDPDFNIHTDRIRFSNADAQGEAKLRWRSVDAKTLAKGGLIDLSGTLNRADATQVYRYLPKSLGEPVRRYVQAAVKTGQVGASTFKVKGPANLVPFADKRLGEFNIEAKLAQLHFAYLPDYLRSAAEVEQGQHWPALENVNAKLVVDGKGLRLENATARLEGARGLALTNVNAQIKDFHTSTVEVQALAAGPIVEVLERVGASPLQHVMGSVFDKASLTGNANYKLDLKIPLHDSKKMQVAGEVLLLGNNVQMSPDIPALEQVKGQVTFSEKGFTIVQATAQAVGGQVTFKGGMQPSAKPGRDATALDAANNPEKGTKNELAFEAEGNFSAQGLRQTRSLGFLANAANYLEGSAPYTLKLHFKQGLPEIDFQSSLYGVSSSLPAPLGKPAEAEMALVYQSNVLDVTNSSQAAGVSAKADRFALRIGNTGEIVQAQYERSLSALYPTVTRGSIGVGLEPGESPPEPDTGVGASLKLKKINTTDWLQLFAVLTSDEQEDDLTKIISPAKITQLELTERRLAALTYLPNVLALRAEELWVQNRSIRNLLVGGSRENTTWRANILADGVSGYAEYTQPEGKNAGHIFARMPQLTLGAQEVSDVRTIVETRTTSVPSVDVVVDDLKLDKMQLGKLVMNAENIAHEVSTGSDEQDREAQLWRLNELSMTVPEASLRATGFWGYPDSTQNIDAKNEDTISIFTDATSATSAAHLKPKRIRTQFEVQTTDIGAFLNRIGMKELHEGGSGNFKGHITWVGSPLAIDYPSLGGQMSIDIRKGQILKVDPGASKLLGLFSLQFLPRLLTLDLRNELGQGFAYDTLKGTILVDQGVAQTSDTVMDSASLARVEISGSTNIASTEQDLRVKVIPQISLGSAAVAAGLINPTLFLLFPAQWVAGKWLAFVATEEYHVHGSWSKPIIDKVKK